MPISLRPGIFLPLVTCAVAAVLIVPNRAAAQELKFETLDQAARDPLVIELLGKDLIDVYRKQEQQRAGDNRKLSGEIAGSDLAYDLGTTISDMTNRFSYRRFRNESDKLPFDASTYLLTAEKIAIVKRESTNPRLQQYLDGILRRAKYLLDKDTVVYAWGWYAQQLAAKPRDSGEVAEIIKKDFLIAPYAFQGLLTPKHFAKYKAIHKQIYTMNSGDPAGPLGDGSGFAKMQKAARRDAATWYANHRQAMNAQMDQQTLAVRKKFYTDVLRNRILNEASVKLIKYASRANSQNNNAANGLKYAEINCTKAAALAKQGDTENANSYWQSARESALELSVAALQLSETERKMKQLRGYMVDHFADQTRIPNIGDLDIATLRQRLANHPSGGNFNTASKNLIDRLIRINVAIHKVEGFVAETTVKCGKIDDVLQSGQTAVANSAVAKAKAGTATFDVSSKAAFEASKQKIISSLSVADQVAFSQAWVKLLLAAIKNDSMVMADDKKFLAFIKKDFQGKTAQDIIGK